MEKTTHRTLFSFRPHIELVAALIHLARRAHALHPSQSKVRMLLSSSIAVLRYCKNKFPFTVPETPNLDPETVTRMGYAEAKWVCEKLLTRAADQYSSEIEAVALRIGQLSGPERSSGAWKVGEHIPALVQACYHKGAFSHLEGSLSWLPVDRAARSLIEILFHQGPLDTIMHLENPTRQPAHDVVTIMADHL